MEVHLIVPACALAVQVASVFYTIRLWRYTGSRALSILLLLIVSLMAVRRAISLTRFFINGEMRVDLIAETAALLISCLILLAIIYIVRIVSQERRHLDALVSAEARYHALFNQSPDGVLLIDARGTIVEFNDETCRQLGYTREEFRNLRIADIDPVESPEQIRETFEKVAREGKAEFEVKHKTRSGEIRDVLVLTQTVHVAGEMYHHTIWRDITERKKAEKALVESERRYRVLFDQSPDGILLLSMDGRILEFNEAAHRDLGYTREEFSRLSVSDLDPFESPEDVRERMNGILRDGKASFYVKHRTKQGELRDVHVIIHVIHLSGGSVAHGIWHDVTDIRKMRDALEEKTAEQNAILESALVGIAFLKDRRFIWINSKMEQMFGYQREEIRGQTTEKLYPSHQDYEQFGEDAYPLLAKGETYSGERHMMRKDGSVFWCSLSGRTITTGTLEKGSIWILQDISERKNAEAALFESESRLRLFIDHAPAALAMFDRNMRYLAASRRWFADYALKDADIIGRSHYEVLPGMPEHWKAGHQRGLAGEVVRGNADLFLGPDGSNRWVTWELRPWFDAGGGVGGIVIFSEDITERKEAEEKIRQSEQFIRSILDTVDEGFIVVDRDYRIQTANKAYCEQTGADCESIIGRHCYEVSHKTPGPCHESGEDCAPRHVFETGKPYSALHKHMDAKGAIMYVETKGFPIRDASGAVVSVIETISNITEKHLLEEERLKTQKLESIGMLAGGIAHDFNNLLQGVFGYLSMAKLTLGEKGKAQAMLEQAEKALHQSVNLTTQLLTFSKGGRPVMKTLSLVPVIENAVTFALSGSRSTNELRIAGDLWLVEGDEGQLGQVIQNIVLNADQAMPLGGSVVISARNLAASDPSLPRELAGRDAVVLSIQDTGVGIPEQYLAKIFDPYFTTKEKGTGLGLATTYSIVRNHGGLVRVKSTAGEGSTFFLYLPASRERSEEKASPAAHGVRRSGRILVMDDEEVIRMVAQEMLGALGHEAAFADKGETAVEAFQAAWDEKRPFDVVILDLTIRGGMGGADTLKHLLQIDPAVKAVVSSGYSDDAIAARYRDQGFKGFLKKPYNVDELQHVLDMLLNA